MKKFLKKKPETIWIAVGGTGGHVFPAEQLASLLEKEDKKILFIGAGLTKNPFFSRNRFSFQEVNSCNFSKGFFKAVAILGKSLWFCLRLIKQKRPSVVVGMGSFHSFPVLLAAYLKKVPLVLLEPNCSLGRVNKFFAKKADVLAMPFSEEKGYRTVSIKPLSWFFLSPLTKKKQRGLTFLVFGGSQGAKAINEILPNSFLLLQEKGLIFSIFHITGGKQDPSDFYKEKKIKACVSSFEKDMPSFYQKADIVIARSGASTLSEVIFYEKPTLFIPYPFAGEHQKKNALFFCEKVKGGKMLLEEESTPDKVAETLLEIKNKRDYYQSQIHTFKEQQNGKSLSHLIVELIRNQGT